MIPQKMKKAWKYLVPLMLLVIVALAVLMSAFKYKSFEGKIESLTIESYHVDDFGGFLPPPTEVLYQVRRISIRTEKDRILDLAVYPSDLDKESVGKFIKGSYKPGNILEIKGENVILGFIDMPGPKIQLRGNPDGVIRTYEMTSAQIR